LKLPIAVDLHAFAAQHRYWLLALQLVSLLLVLQEGPATLLGRVLWLGHVGLFLLWQPIVAGESRLSPLQTGLVLLAVLLVSTTLGWGWLAGWVALLAAIVGGKVAMARERRFGLYYLFVFAYLLFVLLAWVAPQIVGGEAPLGHQSRLLIAAGLLGAALLAVPLRKSETVAEIYDFVASLLLLLLLVVVLLGATSLMALAHLDYFNALLRTLFGLAAILLLLSWAWNPRPGFGGFGIFVSTYLMRLGFPFDAWLRRLITLAETVDEPAEFLQQALSTFALLPWVTGGDWQHGAAGGRFGEGGRQESVFIYGGVHLRLHTAYAWTASLIWQASLLHKLVVELHRAKQHERALRQMRFVQSVHETGARLTHDMKNLLQSLDSLCFAAARPAASAEEERALHELLRRQLPAISERLRGTLDKLARPQPAAGDGVPLDVWWTNLQQRFAREAVAFGRVPAALAGGLVPAAVFDSVAENLLANALGKRREQLGVRVRVSLLAAGGGAVLRVEDDGAAIPEAIAASLFREPVESATGMGIGLLQAARLAELAGWRLRLVDNRSRCVAFELEAAPPA
jgi:signal transduction histidine kinase